MYRPLGRVNDRVPVISDGYKNPPLPGERYHPGIDCLFARILSDPHDERGTRNYYMPYGAQVVASAPGQVVEVSYPERGTRVYVRHDAGELDGLHTVYEHFTEVYVAIGQDVQAGEALGAPGYDLKNGEPGSQNPYHLHFEIRESGPHGGYLNPFPFWKRWVTYPFDDATSDLVATVSSVADAFGGHLVTGDVPTLMLIGGMVLLVSEGS